MPGMSIRNKISKLPYADMNKLPSTKMPVEVPAGDRSDYYTDESTIGPGAKLPSWKDKPIDPYGVENWRDEWLHTGKQVAPDDEGFDAALIAATAGAYGAKSLGGKIGKKMAERAAIPKPSRSENLQRLFRDPPKPDNVPTGTGRPRPLDALSDDWIKSNTAYPRADAVGNVHNLQAKRERRDQYNDLVNAYEKSKAVKKPSREISDDELLDIYDKDKSYWDSFPED